MLQIKKKQLKSTFPITLIRILSFFLETILIQSYQTKEYLLTDFHLKIQNQNLFKFFKLLRYSLLLNYDQLSTLTCLDNLNLDESKARFTLIYVLNQINTTSRLIVSVDVSPKIFLPSITSIYKSANWLEREVFDLFGLFFQNHYDLRRILTDYGFKGFPLRKDFPLSGYFELRYNETEKYVKYQPLTIIQNYRLFYLDNC